MSYREVHSLKIFCNMQHFIVSQMTQSVQGFYCGQERLTLPKSQWECSRKKCLNKSKGRPKPKVKEETYNLLKKFYAQHNEIFYSLVNQDFAWPTG